MDMTLSQMRSVCEEMGLELLESDTIGKGFALFGAGACTPLVYGSRAEVTEKLLEMNRDWVAEKVMKGQD